MSQAETIDVSDVFAQEAAEATADKLCLFLSQLRELGFNIGIGEARDAFALAVNEGGYSRPLFQSALKHLLCTDLDQCDRFDGLFLSFYGAETEIDTQGSPVAAGERFEKQFTTEFQFVADFYENEQGDDEAGAGRDDAVTKTDFRFLTEQAGWEEAAKTAERLARQIKMRQMRRWRKSSVGKRLDLASTARKLAATDGDPLYIGRKRKKLRPMRVVALLDVSHSMSYYSPMFTRFVRGLAQHFDKTEAFCFHVELNKITDILLEEDREVMRQRMEDHHHLWFGGTNIAESVTQFNKTYLSEIASSNTVVLLFSDGCDCCAPDEMIPPFEELRRNVRRIFWVNPMKARLERGGLESSSPIMAARSFIDGQVSGDSLRALETLARVMSR